MEELIQIALAMNADEQTAAIKRGQQVPTEAIRVGPYRTWLEWIALHGGEDDETLAAARRIAALIPAQRLRFDRLSLGDLRP